MTPLLLLDVDGVLNALSDDLPDPSVWSRWQRGFAKADGMSWPIVFALDVVEQLVRWHEQGAAELQWLTTWGHAANGGLRDLLGMPRLQVAGTYDNEDAPVGASSPDALSHAAAAPSAPDPLSGQWWKYDVVRRVLDQQPDRLVVWLDDELHSPTSPFRRWAEQQPNLRPVGPDPRSGLTPHDLDVIRAALQAGGAAA